MADGLTTKQQAFVAAYLGSARFNATKAAEMAGYAKARQSGSECLSNPVIKQAIDAWRDEVKTSAITDLSYRVARLAELEIRLWGVVDARQEAYTGTDVIGGETGLVVLQRKQIGGGPTAETVEEYVADVAVAKAIQSVYDDVAKELGQRIDKVNVSGNLTREYVIVRPGEQAPTGEPS
jgi:hypothetical protein